MVRRRPTKNGRELTPAEQVKEIIAFATGLGIILERHSHRLNDEQRARIENAIADAYHAIRQGQGPKRGKRTPGLLAENVLSVIGRFALMSDSMSEQKAIDGAIYQIGRQLDDYDGYNPPELHGARPTRATVAACLRTWGQRPGRPNGPRTVEQTHGKHEALLRLLKELGLSGATDGEAIKKLIQRRRHK